MRSKALPILASLACLAAASCHGGAPSGRPAGQESFVAQAPGGGSAPLAAGTGPGPAVGGSTPGAAASAPRTVEEADLYQLSPDGRTLYVLNGFRGLQLVDLADLDHPALLGRVPATGRPLDLYLRGAIAYFTVSDAVVWAWAAGPGAVAPLGGSELWTVDVTDPASPRVLSRLGLPGSAVESRLVGDVLYVFSRRYGWWDAAPVAAAGASGGSGVASGGTAANLFYLASFDLSDPSAPRAVDQRSIDATGWDAHANVSAERVTLAQAGWEGSGEVTRFTVFDIADPGGAIVSGAVFDTPGRVLDRWGMDFDAGRGLFRAVVATGWNAGAALRCFTSPGPQAAALAGEVAVGAGEGLTAARFDGPRAYVVTAAASDPLFTVDTSDPAAPRVSGAVQLPGQLEFVEPRGDRLLALGHTSEGGISWQLAASLLDVTDPAAPALLARVLFGDGYGWLTASPDDARKAFQVLDGQGLVLVPFQGWEHATWAWSGGVQLLDLDLAAGTLVKRGFVPHPGSISRAFALPGRAGQLGALSDQRLQLLDATDRSAPFERGGLDLARPVIDLTFVGGQAVELAGDFWRGDTALVVTSPLDPDAPAPLARVAVPAPMARMFTLGSTVWLLASDWSGTAPVAWLQAIDLADPLHPRLADRLELASADAPGFWGQGWGDEAVLVGTALAVHRQPWRGPLPMAGGGGAAPADELVLYDLASPDAPRLAGRLALPDSDWSWGLTASGGQLWITQFHWSDGSSAEGRYLLDRIDAGDPSAPRLVSQVNVPGLFLGAAPGGDRVYTLEWDWTLSPSGPSQPKVFLHALDLTARGTARLAASVALEGDASTALLQGGYAYLATTSGWQVSAGAPTTRLWAVDLGRMSVASSQAVDSAWVYPLALAGGRLFLAAWAQQQAILIYGLSDPARPAFEQAAATPGWVRTVAVQGEYAYLPAGPYGVPMVKLTR